MFNKKIPIIYLSKTKLKVALVKLDREPKIVKSDETGWNKDSLTDSFKQAKKQLKAKTVRLLLADDLAYILEFNIPFDTKPSKERQVVKKRVQAEVPEILEHDDWDFKETGRKTQKEKQIIAFAPVKSAFSLISESFTNANVEVAAIEPEAISKIRHKDPFIGLALKTDLKGKDKKVLNLKLKKFLSSKPTPKSEKKELPKSDSKIYEPTVESEPPSPPVNKTFIIIFLITFILSGLVIGGILVQNNALQSRPSPTPSPLVISSPKPTPTPTPSPSPEPKIILSDFKILVLNGTGGKGIAAAVKDILEQQGFEDIKADNADSFGFTQTEIQLKSETPEKIWQIIEQALTESYEVTQSAELLKADSQYDAVITVGEKN